MAAEDRQKAETVDHQTIRWRLTKVAGLNSDDVEAVMHAIEPLFAERDTWHRQADTLHDLWADAAGTAAELRVALKSKDDDA